MKRMVVVGWILAASALIIGCSLGTKDRSSLEGEWLFKVDSLNRGLAEEWYAPKTDRSHWDRHQLPGFWDRYANLASYDGVGWYARTFDIKDTAQHMSVFFGGVDDDADVWVNGIGVGSHVGYSDAFALDVSHAVRQGKNELVVRVRDESGAGGIYKPVTLVPTERVEGMFRTKESAVNARTSEDWVKDAVIYEVYLRSFSKEGTFRALESRLGELKQLGVTVVWLMPIHPVGELNRKGTLGSPYAVRDFYDVNPEFGTMDDFKSLVAAVHQQGMKIIIDLVANHTAWDARMLLEHPEWYTKNEEGAIISPNPDWTDVADLNYDNHELRKYMIRMMRHWVEDIGIDGFRCDVAEMVPTDFWETARGELDRVKGVMMLSEGTLPEHHVKAFDLTYSWNVYDILGRVIDGTTPASIFPQILKTESYQFPRRSLRMRFNTNHDKNAWDAPAVEKFTPDGAKATAVLAFTFPGVPLVYSGEEVGNPKRLSLFEKVDIDWSGGVEFRRLYSALTELRRSHPAFRGGDYRQVTNSLDAKVLSFVRTASSDTVLTVVNWSKSAQSTRVTLPADLPSTWRMSLGTATMRAVPGGLELDIPALGFAVLSTH